MAEPLLGLGSFNIGIPSGNKTGFLTLTMDGAGSDIPHTQLLEWNGQSLGDIDLVPWNAIGLAVLSTSEMFGVGESGQVYRFLAGNRAEEQIPNQKEPRGPLRAIRAIEDQLFVVGMDCQVFRRSKSGEWQAIDGSLRNRATVKDVPGLESVFGIDGNSVFAVGWHGTILHYTNNDWDVEQTPTNSILTDGVQMDDGSVVACGRSGTILVGRPGLWEVIDHPFSFVDFWGIGVIRNRVILSSYNGIFEFSPVKQVVQPMLIDLDPVPLTFGRLGGAFDLVWSVGTKDVIQFDGIHWSRVI